jgi:hypothetical protein
MEMKLGVAVDDSDLMLVAFDGGETEIAKLVSVAFDGDQISGISFGKFLLDDSGYPGSHGAEAIAAMDNDIKLTLQGKSDQVSFNYLHLSSFKLLILFAFAGVSLAITP